MAAGLQPILQQPDGCWAATPSCNPLRAGLRPRWAPLPHPYRCQVTLPARAVLVLTTQRLLLASTLAYRTHTHVPLTSIQEARRRAARPPACRRAG